MIYIRIHLLAFEEKLQVTSGDFWVSQAYIDVCRIVMFENSIMIMRKEGLTYSIECHLDELERIQLLAWIVKSYWED